MSPDSETIPNTLVLVAHGTTSELRRLEEMRISECFRHLHESQPEHPGIPTKPCCNPGCITLSLASRKGENHI